VLWCCCWMEQDNMTNQNTISSKSTKSIPLKGADRARILVADDDSDNLHYLSRVLEQHWIVESINHGSKALEAVKARPPDLVITDVFMPGLNGFELIQELRADPKTKMIPVILLSGADEDETQERVKKAGGVNDILIKPADAKEIVVRVRAVLEGKSNAKGPF
jgi:PleD family two-component response regulator